jgi:hypothetical protein
VENLERVAAGWCEMGVEWIVGFVEKTVERLAGEIDNACFEDESGKIASVMNLVVEGVVLVVYLDG